MGLEDVGLDQIRSPASISTPIPTKPVKTAKTAIEPVDGWFISGPLPGDWLVKAAKLPGNSNLLVALAILYVKNMKAGKTATLERYHLGCDRFGVKKDSTRRALVRLQEAGLISYTKKGQKFIVTVHPYIKPSPE